MPRTGSANAQGFCHDRPLVHSPPRRGASKDVTKRVQGMKAIVGVVVVVAAIGSAVLLAPRVRAPSKTTASVVSASTGADAAEPALEQRPATASKREVGKTRYVASAAPSAEPAEVPAAVEMLNPEGVAAVLQLVQEGVRIQDSLEYQRFLEQTTQDPTRSLALLKDKFAGTTPADVGPRSQIFGLMIEMTLAVAENGGDVDRFVQDAAGLIDDQVHTPAKVAARLPQMSYEQMQELTHLGPYTMEQGQLYANTFQPKFMAVAVLKEAHTNVARAHLSRIANNANVDPLIRRVAALHANEQGSMQR